MSESRTEVLKMAAMHGDVQAQWDLSICYLNGDGVEQDNTMALSWMIKAAENGKEEAVEIVLNAYKDGDETLEIEQDYEKLLEYAEKFSAAGSRYASFMYAFLNYNHSDFNFKIDMNKFEEAIIRAGNFADKGEAAFCSLACDMASALAGIYDEMSKYEKAEALLKRSIGWIEAVKGTKYEYKDSFKAKCWYRYGKVLMALDRDNEAAQWYRKAAEYNPNAEMFYAFYLLDEVSRTHNTSLCKNIVTYLTHAVNSAEEKAQPLEAESYRTLAGFARDGLGMTADMNKSYQWMCRAAELGNEKAQQELKRYRKKLFGGYSYQ